jgi:TonB family protein
MYNFNKQNKMKTQLVVWLIAFMAIGSYCNAQDSKSKEKSVDEIFPYAVVDTKPKFQEKDASEFSKWINSKLANNYPPEAMEKNIQGIVRVSFTINEDGTLSDIKSLRKADRILEDHVIELVKTSPAWTPGRQKDKPVKVTYQIPVAFKLQQDILKQKAVVDENGKSDDIFSYATVDAKPRFQGKEAVEFVNWMNLQLASSYPQEAMEKNIQGIVRVSFTINEDGTLSDIKSLRKADRILEDHVIELVRKSPKWTPGRQKDKPVKVTYQVPVVFKLQE